MIFSHVTAPLQVYHIVRSLEVELSPRLCSYGEFVVMTLPWSSPVVNPIFYSFFGRRFRTQLKDIARSLSKKYTMSSTSKSICLTEGTKLLLRLTVLTHGIHLTSEKEIGCIGRYNLSYFQKFLVNVLLDFLANSDQIITGVYGLSRLLFAN